MNEIEYKFELLSRMIEASQNIYILKEQMRKSDKDSQDYYLLSKQYEVMLKVEDNVYDEFKGNTGLIFDIINYLKQRYNVKSFNFKLDYFSELENNIIYKRIINKLDESIIEYLFDNIISKKNDFDDVEEEFFEEYDEECNEEYDDEYDYVFGEEDYNYDIDDIIDSYFVKDFILLLLSSLEQLKKEDSNYLDYINKFQSDLIFAFGSIGNEKDLEDSSNISLVYLNSKLISDILEVDDTRYNILKNSLVKLIISENINAILDKNKELILYSMLSSCFTLLETDSYSQVMKKTKNNSLIKDNNQMETILNKIEKDIDKNRENCMYVSFRKIKKL